MPAVITPDVGSPILSTDPVVFDVTDSTETLTDLIIAIRHSTGLVELVHTGVIFEPLFTSGSTRTVITNGFHFSVIRAGGWTDTPIVVSAFPFAGSGGGAPINFSSDFLVISDPPDQDVALSVTGVTAGTYGDATHVGQFQTDSKGRLVAAASVAINFAPSIATAEAFATAADVTVAANAASALAIETAARIAGDVALSSTPPAIVTKSAALVGTGTTSARADHKHDVSTAAVGDVGTSNTEGSSTSLARSDHTHNLPFTPVQTALAAATGNVSLNSRNITNLLDGVNPQDAATIHQLADHFVEVDGITVGAEQLVTQTFPVEGLVIAKVETLEDLFYLDRGNTQTADGITIVTALGGVGRWVRMFVSSSVWISQSVWKIDPISGSDENLGDSTHPLKTKSELARRLGTQRLISPMTVTVTSSVLSTDVEMPRCQTDLTNFISWVGVPQLLFSGTITALTNRNGSTGQPTLMTINSIASSWTLGNGTTSFLNMLVEWTDGSGHFITSRVCRDNGGKQAWLSAPITEGNVEGTFTNGNTVSIYDVPSLGNTVSHDTTKQQFTYLKVAQRWISRSGQLTQFKCWGDAQYVGGTIDNINGVSGGLFAGANLQNLGARLNLTGGYHRLINTAGVCSFKQTTTFSAIQIEDSQVYDFAGGAFGQPDVEICTTATTLSPLLFPHIGTSWFNAQGFIYGTTAVTGAVFADLQGRQATISLGHVPNVTGANLISYALAGITENVSVLTTRESNDINGNRVIGPAGPTLNDNRSQPIAHLGSGGTTTTNAANIGDVQSATSSVANKAALIAIDTTGLATGSRRFVKTYLAWFTLDKDTTDRVAEPDSVIAPTTGTGLWVRDTAPDQYWANQGTWFIDPINGNNENEGDTLVDAIKTRTEYAWRTDGQQATKDVTINITSDLLPTDTRLPHREQISIEGPDASGFLISYIGTKIPLFTGTLTTVVNRNGSTATTTKLTIAGLPVSWTASGLVGKIIEGVNGSGGPVRAVIVADLGSKTAWVSPPQQGTTINSSGEDTFANGTSITVYDCVNLATGLTPTIQTIRYQYADFQYCKAPRWEFTGNYAQFVNCMGTITQHGDLVLYMNCVMIIAAQNLYSGVYGGYVNAGTTLGANLFFGAATTIDAHTFPITPGGSISSKDKDVEVNASTLNPTLPVIRLFNGLASASFGGFFYGVTAGTDIVRFDTKALSSFVQFKNIPSFGGASGVNFVDAGVIASTATLATRQLDDQFGNKVIGPAGPTVNDNRSQPIAHLGSGGATTTNAANIGDVLAAAGSLRAPKPGEFWVYCIDYDGRTLVGNDATAAPGIAGPKVRTVAVTGADHVVGSTRTWTFANGAFTSEDVRGLLTLTGATNAKTWQILSVTNATTVVTATTGSPNFVPVDAPVDETFTTGATLVVTGGPASAMAAALVLAVLTPFKTYERAGQLTPRNGGGASLVVHVRPRSGRAVYKDMDGTSECDWDKWIKDCFNWFYIGHRPTGDFSNSAADKVQLGYRIIPGLNAGGYNPTVGRAVTVTGTDHVVASSKTWTFANGAFTALDIDRDLVLSGVTNAGTFRITRVPSSTTVITSGSPVNETFNTGSPVLAVNSSTRSFSCQLAGGGAAALPGNGTGNLDGSLVSNVPYLTAITGKRIRFRSTTTTTALQNFCTSVYMNDVGNIVPSFALPAAFSASDVFDIEENELRVGKMIVQLGMNLRVQFVCAYAIQVGGPVFATTVTGVAWFSGIDCPNDLGSNHLTFTNNIGRTTVTHRQIDEIGTVFNMGQAGIGRMTVQGSRGGFIIAGFYSCETGQRNWYNNEWLNVGPGCIFNGGFFLQGGSTHGDVYTIGDATDTGSGALADLSTGIGLDTTDGIATNGAFGGPFGTNIYKRTRFPGITPASSLENGGIILEGPVNVRIHGIDFSNRNPCIQFRGQGGHAFIDDLVSSSGGVLALVDLANAYHANVVIGTYPSAGLGGVSADPALVSDVIRMAGGALGGGPIVSAAALSLTSYNDCHGNIVQGTGGVTN